MDLPVSLGNREIVVEIEDVVVRGDRTPQNGPCIVSLGEIGVFSGMLQSDRSHAGDLEIEEDRRWSR